MAGAGRDHHGDVTYRELAHPVHRSHLYAVGSGDLGTDLAQPFQGGGMRAVAEPGDRAGDALLVGVATVVIADPADEERHCATRGVIERGADLGDVEWGLADVDESYGAHARDPIRPIRARALAERVPLFS